VFAVDALLTGSAALEVGFYIDFPVGVAIISASRTLDCSAPASFTGPFAFW
jgi:hypothetical protein